MLIAIALFIPALLFTAACLVRRDRLPRAHLRAPWWRRLIAHVFARDVVPICSLCGCPTLDKHHAQIHAFHEHIRRERAEVQWLSESATLERLRNDVVRRAVGLPPLHPLHASTEKHTIN
jgi:hypothetical protein